MHPAVRRATASLLQLVSAGGPTIARPFAELVGSSVRLLRWHGLSARALNLFSSTHWPEVELRPRRVTLGAATRVILRPHLGEFDLAALMSRRPDYEAPVFRFLEGRVSGYAAVVEIGANVGVYTVFFARLLEPRAGKVYAFEPSRAAFSRLLDNLDLNGATNVEPCLAAVSERAGFADLHEPEGHLTNGSLSPEFARLFSTSVTARPVVCVDGSMLAELLERHPGPLLVKVDAEGSEPEVLSTLGPLLRDRRPDLVIEVLPGSERALDALVPAGYARLLLTSRGPVQRPALVGGVDRDWFLTPGATA